MGAGVATSSPLDEQGGSFSVLVNNVGQYSLWPAFLDVPSGWRVGYGQSTRQECLAYLDSQGTTSDPAGVTMAGGGDSEEHEPMELQHLLRSRARSNPTAVAVVIGAETITYHELLRAARTGAARLRRAGVEPGTFVGVGADRSLDTVIGIFGILFSGAAYVPIDVNLPSSRVHSVLADAGIRFVTGPRIPAVASARHVTVVAAGELEDVDDIDQDRAQVRSGAAAYAIFTSGSTGASKGVVVLHRTAVRSTLTRFQVYPHEDVSYLMLAPLTTDAAVAGLYFTLAAGGRVVVPTAEELLDPEFLAELIVRERVTHFDGLPSQYAPVLRFHPDSLRGLGCVVLGGESLPGRLVRRHLAALPDVPLYNEYGPTECTVWSTVHRCTENDVGPLVPIGRPIAGTRASVLTEKLTEAPAGVVGEIFIAGAGLAHCYLNRPALTAQRFVADPDQRYPGERMYRTGDLGFRDEAGDLVFTGRVDNVVKVRGFLVEPDEVEARLLEHPELVGAAVVPEAGLSGTRLVAVVATAPGSALGWRELADFVADRLPKYMIPAVWRKLDVLPVTANGKVDRRLLTSTGHAMGTALPGNTNRT
jgi:amino acid adenylation domain-containing protein